MSAATSQELAPGTSHDALVASLQHVRQTVVTDVLAWQREWIRSVAEALDELEQALRQHHAAADGSKGESSPVDETRPTLARRSDALGRNQGDLLDQLMALRDEVNAADGSEIGAMWGSLRDRAEHLVTDLHKSLDKEADLVHESVNTDIGGGD